ncbi:TetR family transcriptional regulator [Amycolatopsis sp. FBCC-B4732]|uniref:TetR family transcriptional regulator n=1 Tax=Amycolatopsis sp. FBCC-B4732 TaxID=3079339 RepID=UPI001FF2CF12|nr:TetR family transcriptional regulator [Amycolatopsis sp. FBCC-B4732]UOX90736.1 TetR family transcriptional regulator [Amycolatopsis sp. FBCC-B4732]
MPRWEEGSEERMKQSAMELFEEQGFEATTAVQIAERARVTTRTFFRYFPDKEEILFADADLLNAALVRELLRTPDLEQPLRTVVRTLAGYDWEKLGSRDLLRRRSRLIASNPGLLERDLIKRHQMAEGFRRALGERGVDPDTAELAASTGSQIFGTAYRKWLESDDSDLTTITDSVTSLLADIVPAARPPRGRRRAPAAPAAK